MKEKESKKFEITREKFLSATSTSYNCIQLAFKDITHSSDQSDNVKILKMSRKTFVMRKLQNKNTIKYCGTLPFSDDEALFALLNCYILENYET